MNKRPLISAIVFAALIAVGAPLRAETPAERPEAAARAPSECLNDWGKARAIVRQENLLTIEDVVDSLMDGGPGSLVRTTLCLAGGAYEYHLVVRLPDGQLKSIVIGAKSRRKDATGR